MRSTRLAVRLGATLCFAFLMMAPAKMPASKKGKQPSAAAATTTAAPAPQRPAPTVKRVLPSSAQPGEKVTIELDNANDVIPRSVVFGDQPATILQNNGGILWVLVPEGLKAGDAASSTVTTSPTNATSATPCRRPRRTSHAAVMA